MPVACFLLFLFPERQKINILGIGRDKSQSYYFSRSNTEPRSKAGGGPQGGQTPLGAGKPWRRLEGVWAPWTPADCRGGITAYAMGRLKLGPMDVEESGEG